MSGKKHIVSRCISIILVVLLLVVAIYPVLWLILSSLKTQNELTLNSAFSLPGSLNFDNYVEALELPHRK